MDNLITFLTSLDWRDVATAAGVLFGIVTLIAYLDQRRTSKAQAALGEFARRHVDKEITEEEITQLASRRKALELQITDAIPQLARTAVLREQAEIYRRTLAEQFARLQEVEQELGSETHSTALDPMLRAMLVDKLSPKFQQVQEDQALRDRITIFSVSLVVVGYLLPEGVDSILQLFLGLGLARELARLTSKHFNSERDQRMIRYGMRGSYAAACMLLIAAGCSLVFGDWGASERWLGWAFLGLAGCMAILASSLLRRAEQWVANQARIPAM